LERNLAGIIGSHTFPGELLERVLVCIEVFWSDQHAWKRKRQRNTVTDIPAATEKNLQKPRLCLTRVNASCAVSNI